MNKELIFFRLLILVVLGSLLGFGGHSFYYSYKASEWQEHLRISINEAAKSALECAKRKEFDCIEEKGWRESIDEFAKMRDGYSNLAKVFSQLSYYVPIISIFLFYGGRWIVLGRLKPLIPKKDRGSSTGR